MNTGLRFRVDFDPPILGVGLDIEAMPVAVVPGAPWRATLELFSGAAQQSIVKAGAGGASLWIGGRSSSGDAIDRMTVYAEMIGAGGGATPVDFGTNRMELLVPVGLIA